MVCPRCGKVLPGGSAFCDGCGAPLAGQASPGPGAGGRSSGGRKIGLLAAAVVLCAAAVVLFVKPGLLRKTQQTGTSVSSGSSASSGNSASSGSETPYFSVDNSSGGQSAGGGQSTTGGQSSGSGQSAGGSQAAGDSQSTSGGQSASGGQSTGGTVSWGTSGGGQTTGSGSTQGGQSASSGTGDAVTWGQGTGGSQTSGGQSTGGQGTTGQSTGSTPANSGTQSAPSGASTASGGGIGQTGGGVNALSAQEAADHAAFLSTEDHPNVGDFEWFLDLVLLNGETYGPIFASSEKITNAALLQGGWKAYMRGIEGVYSSDSERYLNADIKTSGTDISVNLKWWRVFDAGGGQSFEESGSTKFYGTWNAAEGTATLSGEGKIELESLFELDGKQYGRGTFLWPSGEKDYIAFVRPGGY